MRSRRQFGDQRVGAQHLVDGGQGAHLRGRQMTLELHDASVIYQGECLRAQVIEQRLQGLHGWLATGRCGCAALQLGHAALGQAAGLRQGLQAQGLTRRPGLHRKPEQQGQHDQQRHGAAHAAQRPVGHRIGRLPHLVHHGAAVAVCVARMAPPVESVLGYNIPIRSSSCCRAHQRAAERRPSLTRCGMFTYRHKLRTRLNPGDQRLRRMDNALAR